MKQVARDILDIIGLLIFMIQSVRCLVFITPNLRDVIALIFLGVILLLPWRKPQ